MKNNNHRNAIITLILLFIFFMYMAISPFITYSDSKECDCVTGIIIDKYLIHHNKSLFKSEYTIAYTVIDVNGKNYTRSYEGREINYYWSVDIIGNNKTICTET